MLGPHSVSEGEKLLQLWQYGLPVQLFFLHRMGSRVLGSAAVSLWAPEHRLSICGTRAQLLCSLQTSRIRIETMSPALEGWIITSATRDAPTFSFLSNRHTVLHSGCTSLHSPQQHGLSLFLWHWYLLSIDSLMVAIQWGGILLWFWFLFEWLGVLSTFHVPLEHLCVFFKKCLLLSSCPLIRFFYIDDLFLLTLLLGRYLLQILISHSVGCETSLLAWKSCNNITWVSFHSPLKNHQLSAVHSSLPIDPSLWSYILAKKA